MDGLRLRGMDGLRETDRPDAVSTSIESDGLLEMDRVRGPVTPSSTIEPVGLREKDGVRGTDGPDVEPSSGDGTRHAARRS